MRSHKHLVVLLVLSACGALPGPIYREEDGGRPDGGVGSEAGASDAGSTDVFPGPPHADAGSADVLEPECPFGQAPLLMRGGQKSCTPVGAALRDTLPEELEAPIVYVRNGSAGDGSERAPFGSLADALRAPNAPRTIVVEDPELPLPSRISYDGRVTIVGRNSATMLRVMGMEGTAIEGINTFLQLRNLRIGGTTSTPGGALKLRDGATVRFDDVSVSGLVGGVVVEGGAQLRGERVTIERAVNSVGLTIRTSSSALLKASLVQDNQRGGVFAEGGTLGLSESYVRANRGIGVALQGALPAGLQDRLDRVSIRDCVHTGLRVSGAGRRSFASYLGVMNSLAGNGGAGDGVVVAAGARFDLDDSTEVNTQGSALVSNARHGLLADGMGTVVSLRGAQFSRNAAVGFVVQNHAQAALVSRLRAGQNGAGGALFIDEAQLVSIRDCVFDANLSSSLQTLSGAVEFGDGLLLHRVRTPLGMDAVSIRDCVFEANRRFGLVMLSSRVMLSGAVTASLNSEEGIVADDASAVSGNVMFSRTNSLRTESQSALDAQAMSSLRFLVSEGL